MTYTAKNIAHYIVTYCEKKNRPVSNLKLQKMLYFLWIEYFKHISVLLIGGLIVFNTIFLMLYIVGKITNRNIYARCKTKDCSCGENGEPTCWGINRIRKRLPYVFWLNLTFLLLIIINTTLWILNMKFHFFPNI